MCSRGLQVLTGAIVLLGVATALAQTPLGTAFNYQGSLSDGGEPVSGTADFRFTLWDADSGGSDFGTVQVDNVTVTDGLFTVTLDFGVEPWVDNEVRWLAIEVRSPSGSGSFTPLSPRQELTPTAFSLATRGVTVDADGDAEFAGDVVTPQTVVARAFAGGSGSADGPGDFVIEAPAGTERARVVDSTGHMGIGTSTPAERLHVEGNSVTTGAAGVGTLVPEARLHVLENAILDFAAFLWEEDTVIEDETAWLGLYYNGDPEIGGDGAGITLGTSYMDPNLGTVQNKWALFRDWHNVLGASRLNFTYGLNANPKTNLLTLQVREDGDTFLTPKTGSVGVGIDPADSIEAPLHVYTDGGGYPNMTARFEQSSGGSSYRSLDVTGTGINAWDLDAPATPVGSPLYLNYRSEGDVYMAYGLGDGGQVGIGDTAPHAKLHVTDGNLFTSPSCTSGEDILIEDSGAAWVGLYSDDTAGGIGGGVSMVEVDSSGTLANKWAIYRRTSSNVGDLVVTYGANCNPGANAKMMQVTQDAELLVGGTAVADAGGAGSIKLLDGSETTVTLSGDADLPLIALMGPEISGVFIQAQSEGGLIKMNSPTEQGTISLRAWDGVVSAKVVEITGADVAERFPTSETVEPGLVVEIDPDNAGQLRVARGAYNRRVAGVVSGAGDLPAGAILGNRPGSESAPPIALTGRVWVYCDATETPIRPGDLLTTADHPGHAMVVRDHARATGATIGKAMSALTRGERGLVLVLVNLQ